MKKRITLIMLKGKNIEFKKAKWDDSTNIASTKEHGKKHNYYVDSKHFLYKKSKIYVLIDVNARTSKSEEKILGKSAEPQLKEELDAQLRNQLDYLGESSYWDSLNIRKRDIVEMFITMGCGIGLYSIFRVILAMYGYYLP